MNFPFVSSNIPSAPAYGSFAMPVVVQIIVTFYHATVPGGKTFVTGLEN